MVLIPSVPAGTRLAKDIGSELGAGTLVVGALTALPALAALALLDADALLAAGLAAGVFLIWLRGLAPRDWLSLVPSVGARLVLASKGFT